MRTQRRGARRNTRRHEVRERGPARDLVAQGRWVLRLAWEASRRLTGGLMALTLLRGLLPAGVALAARGLINSITAAAGATGEPDEIGRWLLLSLGLTVVDATSTVAANYLRHRLTDELNISTSIALLRHAATLDLAHFESPDFQDTIQRAHRPLSAQVVQFISDLLTLLSNVIQLVSLGVLLVAIEPWFTAVMPIVALPFFVFQWWLAQRRHAIEYSRVTQHRWSRYYNTVILNDRWVAETKLLDLAPELIKRFERLLVGFRDQNRRLHAQALAGTIVFTLLIGVAFYIVVLRVTRQVVGGRLSLGDIVVYITALTRLRGSLQTVAQTAGSLREQLLYVAEWRTLMEIRPEMAAPQVEAPLPLRGALEARNVSFTYPGAQRPALHDISLTVQPGETIALVGENGAGKSTLARLIARLHDPTEGAILWGGVDLREVRPETWYAHVGVVLQEFNRYEATAAENIAFGDWRLLLPPDERVQAIARQSGIDELIKNMPDGYDTFLGRMFGVYKPSVGQWQKIAMARAFARPEAALLILDEPTAHLDALAAFELFQRFQELAQGRTTVLISHRFSTVSLAQRIYVLEEGRLVEQGTHDELMRLNERYAAMYRLQKGVDVPAPQQ